MEGETIGERLEELRKFHHLSRKELSRIININEKTIMNYEREERKPSLEYIEAITSYFGVDPSFIVFGHARYITAFTAFLKRYKLVNNLDDEQLLKILDVRPGLLKAWLQNWPAPINDILYVAEKLNVKPSNITDWPIQIPMVNGEELKKAQEIENRTNTAFELLGDHLVYGKFEPHIDCQDELTTEIYSLLKHAPEPFLENLRTKLLEFKNQSSDFFA